METEIDRIVDELNREYSGEAWHGLPLMQILDGITAAQAAGRPLAAAHSILEIVLHVIGWKHEVRRRVSGAPAGEPDAGDWPDVRDASATGWDAARKALDSAHEALLETIRQFPESRLNQPINDPRPESQGSVVSYYVLLHGAVQHDVYHAGQISMLKKATTERPA